MRIGKHLHHRLIDHEAVEIPLLVEHRNNANANFAMSHLQQRRIGIRGGAVYRQPIEIQAKIRKMQSEVL